jgi:hypothetical protein
MDSVEGWNFFFPVIWFTNARVMGSWKKSDGISHKPGFGRRIANLMERF